MGQILLVRHGQASWGAEDYDVLSEVGWEQSRRLGRALVERGFEPGLVLRGQLRRHRETAEGMGFGDDVAELDPGWDEFDSADVFGPAAGPDPSSSAEFQAWFEDRMERWTGGEFEADYVEPFNAFAARVSAALERAAARTQDGPVLVVTSGGPISWVLASLLGTRLPYAEQVVLSRSLNPVCANTSVSKVVTGRRGLTAVQFNEHTHLEAAPALITYR